MNEHCVTPAAIAAHRQHLLLEERSGATVEKYLRSAAAFAAYMQMGAVTRETAIAYKAELQARYAARSINSMLAGLNGLFSFPGWHE